MPSVYRPVLLLLMLGLAQGCTFQAPPFEGDFPGEDSAAVDAPGADLAPADSQAPDSSPQPDALLLYLECIQKPAALALACTTAAGNTKAVLDLDRCRDDNCQEWPDPGQVPTKPGFKPEDLELCILENCMAELGAGGDGSGTLSPCKQFLTCMDSVAGEADPFLDTYRCVMKSNPDADDLSKLQTMVPCYFKWRLSTLSGVPNVKGVCDCFTDCGYEPGICN